jgi:hypothetical protein
MELNRRLVRQERVQSPRFKQKNRYREPLSQLGIEHPHDYLLRNRGNETNLGDCLKDRTRINPGRQGIRHWDREGIIGPDHSTILGCKLTILR